MEDREKRLIEKYDADFHKLASKEGWTKVAQGDGFRNQSGIQSRDSDRDSRTGSKVTFN